MEITLKFIFNLFLIKTFPRTTFCQLQIFWREWISRTTADPIVIIRVSSQYPDKTFDITSSVIRGNTSYFKQSWPVLVPLSHNALLICEKLRRFWPEKATSCTSSLSRIVPIMVWATESSPRFRNSNQKGLTLFSHRLCFGGKALYSEKVIT